jgi:hypothetical protein
MNSTILLLYPWIVWATSVHKHIMSMYTNKFENTINYGQSNSKDASIILIWISYISTYIWTKLCSKRSNSLKNNACGIYNWIDLKHLMSLVVVGPICLLNECEMLLIIWFSCIWKVMMSTNGEFPIKLNIYKTWMT